MNHEIAPKEEETLIDPIRVPLSVLYKSGIASRRVVHYHEAYELCLFEHADARVFLKNTWYDVHDGDVVFVPCNVIHRYNYHELEQYTRMVISFQRDFIMKILRPLDCERLLSFFDNLKVHKVSLPPGQFKQLLLFGNRLLDGGGEAHGQAESQAALLSTLYILLYTLKPVFQKNQKHTALPRENQCIQRVIDYIDAMYATDIKLDDISNHVHIDKYYLCRLFKRHVGTTPVKYVQFRRIIESQKMLLYSDAPIENIVSCCGFNNIQHFYKVFKEFTGHTPLQYRKPERFVRPDCLDDRAQ